VQISYTEFHPTTATNLENRAEIHLRPGVKFRFQWADFNKNHSRSINLVKILYTELHSDRSRNMESTSRNSFTPWSKV